MFKKLTALLLALVMCLSLVACGSTANQEKFDVENAIAETPVHICDDMNDNQSSVMQNTYLIDCSVGTISGAYFECGNLRIYLATEELAQLTKGERIAIIGKVTGTYKEDLGFGAYTEWVLLEEAALYDGEIPDVEPREHEIFTGQLEGKNADGSWDIVIDRSIKHLFFADGEDLSAFDASGNSSTEVTVYIPISKDIGEMGWNYTQNFYSVKIIK